MEIMGIGKEVPPVLCAEVEMRFVMQFWLIVPKKPKNPKNAPFWFVLARGSDPPPPSLQNQHSRNTLDWGRSEALGSWGGTGMGFWGRGIQGWGCGCGWDVGDWGSSTNSLLPSAMRYASKKMCELVKVLYQPEGSIGQRQ